MASWCLVAYIAVQAQPGARSSSCTAVPFDVVVQALAAAGHTVLVPNVRGSTGYGKRWYTADDKLSEAEQIHAAMTARGRECELLVYGDEGHGLTKRENRAEAFSRAFAFLARHLGG
jgi:dipeptidyl aminopeptidase/acylaminoacyl peptidase